MVQIVKLVNACEACRRGFPIYRERRHRRSSLCFRERLCVRLNHIYCLAAEAIKKKIAHELAIIHVQPFRSSDQCTMVSSFSPFRDRKEKVDVQSGQRTCVQIHGFGFIAQPLFPFRIDQVVTHIRRISDI